MKRSFQTMTFATLCLAALVSPVAVQAQGNEAFGPDPSLEAGECQAIPPEEWGATFDFEFEDCQDQVVRVAGEGSSVADAMGQWLDGGAALWDGMDDLIWCQSSQDFNNYSTAVESACWPNEKKVLQAHGVHTRLRVTMKLPLQCEIIPTDPTKSPYSTEVNATVTADFDLCPEGRTEGLHSWVDPWSFRMKDSPHLSNASDASSSGDVGGERGDADAIVGVGVGDVGVSGMAWMNLD